MRLNPYCLCCLINKQEEKIRQFDDEEKQMIYMKEILRRIADADPQERSPSLYEGFQQYYTAYRKVPREDFSDVKKEYNTLMLELEDKLRNVIHSAPDPLASALLHAAKNLVYLTDNCGEIVLDKLAVEVIKQLYPKLGVTVIVRGMPIVNDATMEDAQMCGLTETADVIGNGSAIGGTLLSDVNEQTRQLLEEADVILSKGQGNFETLHGCGLNIYYLFLCKCQWFVRMFDAELFQGMFVNERRVEIRR